MPQAFPGRTERQIAGGWAQPSSRYETSTAGVACMEAITEGVVPASAALISLVSPDLSVDLGSPEIITDHEEHLDQVGRIVQFHAVDFRFEREAVPAKR